MVGLNTIFAPEAVQLSAGATLLALMYSLGDVSGGHFNPAVTLAVVMGRRQKCTWKEGLLYAGVQFFGAVIGGLLMVNINNAFIAATPAGAALVNASIPGQAALANVTHIISPPAGVLTKTSFIFNEVILTAAVAYVFLAVATTVPRNSMRQSLHPGLAVGGIVAAVGFIEAIDMGTVLMNPAVAYAQGMTAMVSQGKVGAFLGSATLYTLFELCGAIFAVVLFVFSHLMEFQKPDSVVVRQN